MRKNSIETISPEGAIAACTAHVVNNDEVLAVAKKIIKRNNVVALFK